MKKKIIYSWMRLKTFENQNLDASFYEHSNAFFKSFFIRKTRSMMHWFVFISFFFITAGGARETFRIFAKAAR